MIRSWCPSCFKEGKSIGNEVEYEEAELEEIISQFQPTTPDLKGIVDRVIGNSSRPVPLTTLFLLSQKIVFKDI